MLPWSCNQRLVAILDELVRTPLPVRLLVDRALEEVAARNSAQVGRFASIEVQRAPLSIGARVQKRVLDLTVASLGLLMLTPLLALVALLIRVDSAGPVFFRQRRTGFNGKIFQICKFRTMTASDDGTVVKQATRHDTRVTRVGRILRATSIDELPQLWNVIRGEMSIVGPRPHALAHDSEYIRKIDNYAFRHHMKPGLTGWAQVNGYRGETRHIELMERRVEHDLWYINNWSIWLDMRIMAKTAITLLTHKAY